MTSKSLYFKFIKLLGRQKALVALIAIFVVMTITSPNFLKPFNMTEMLFKSSTYAILALGVTLTIIAGGCDLSVGGIMCTSAIITVILQPYMPTWCAIILAIVAGAFIGFINGFLSVHQKTEPFIITLGMGILLKGLGLILTDARPIPSNDVAFNAFGSGSVLGIPNLVIIAVVLIILFHLLMTRTPYGRNLYAIGGDYDVAVYSGIKAMQQKWLTFIISGMTAAVGGVLLAARLGSAAANYGESAGLVINCGVVVGGTSFIGGVGSIAKSMVGIFLFGVIETSLNLLAINTYIQQSTMGILIALIITMDLFAIKRKKEKV